MGPAQGLDTLLEAAELTTAPRTTYVLIGNGVLDDAIAQRIADRRLGNVRRIPHQPYVRMPEIYAASDLCLVPLIDQVSGSALPSKVFRIMACGRPVLALCNPESELAELIRASGAGVVVPPGKPELLRDAVQQLAGQPERRAEMGRRGRALVEREYSRPAVTGRYARLIADLARAPSYS
jgi:colanic acid biosynthesis glycosyl transferase WcaI